MVPEEDQGMRTYVVRVDGVVLGEQTSSRRLTHAVVARLAPRFGPKGRALRVLCFNGAKAHAVREARVAWQSRLYRDVAVVPVAEVNVEPEEG